MQFVKGSDFVLDGAESSLRLAYSGVTPEEIEEGVRRLAEAYHALSGVRGRECGVRRSRPSATSPARPRRARPARSTSCTRGSPSACGAGSGRPPLPVRLAHDRIARSAYSAASELTRTVVRAGAHAAGARAVSRRAVDRAHARRPGRGRRAQRRLRRHARAAGQSARPGDDGPPPRARSGHRADPSCAAPTRTPSRRLAVFVHGLCETDDAWKLGAGAARALRAPAGDRARLHAGVRALQHRPPHLRERPRAGDAAREARRGVAGPRSTRSC